MINRWRIRVTSVYGGASRVTSVHSGAPGGPLGVTSVYGVASCVTPVYGVRWRVVGNISLSTVVRPEPGLLMAE